MIGHEKGVELSGFQFLCESLDMGKIEICISESAGISPGACVNADWAHESTEPEFSCIA